ncbi:hypothetical protein EVG20_g1142 [Dentipellis fragilis]|uniref:NADH:flavin oxidoreductase/NADH oxidase N-terminal domain-containing protein n=1 Tax=Dentipellis fragilis TaxID=205917 RepID=A0A4Y9ZBL8_9AGAM|nr:hypothetical protein EVG20_g1142 [Dentipellis fragilis]
MDFSIANPKMLLYLVFTRSCVCTCCTACWSRSHLSTAPLAAGSTLPVLYMTFETDPSALLAASSLEDPGSPLWRRKGRILISSSHTPGAKHRLSHCGSAAGGSPDDVWGPLTIAGIPRIVAAVADAAKCAVRVGFDVIKSILRTGSFCTRSSVLVSAIGWLEQTIPDEPSWCLENTVRSTGLLATHGIDFLDVPSGGADPMQKIGPQDAYQVPFSNTVKKAHADRILVGTVGGITTGTRVQQIQQSGQADVAFVGRMFQKKNPRLVWSFAEDLGVEIYNVGRAWTANTRNPYTSVDVKPAPIDRIV